MSPGRDIIVVAASAGGLQPLRAMLSQLPEDLPAAVFVVMHIPATSGSGLASILDRAGPLSAARAVEGEPIRTGRVYVAPPDRHLLVVKDTVRLSRGPRQNGVRPAADPLFRSASLHAGPRVIGIVLSGALDDAALGSATIERRGGRVIAQDPEDADLDSMPRNAIKSTENATVVPTAQLATCVTKLAAEEASAPPAGISHLDEELAAEIGGLLEGTLKTNTASRVYSGLSCPECGGPLYQAEEGHAETFDCLVGHRWGLQALVARQSEGVEQALWLAIRSLEERARTLTKMAVAADERGRTISASRFWHAAGEAQRSADVIRESVTAMTAEVPGESEGSG